MRESQLYFFLFIFSLLFFILSSLSFSLVWNRTIENTSIITVKRLTEERWLKKFVWGIMHFIVQGRDEQLWTFWGNWGLQRVKRLETNMIMGKTLYWCTWPIYRWGHSQGKAVQDLSLWCHSQDQGHQGDKENSPTQRRLQSWPWFCREFREWLPEFKERIKLIAMNELHWILLKIKEKMISQHCPIH